MPTRIQIGDVSHRASAPLSEVEAQVHEALTGGPVARIALVNGGTLVISASQTIALSDPDM